MNLGNEDKNQIIHAVKAIVTDMQSRGEDSTGVVAIFVDREEIYKAAEKASDFVESDKFNAFMERNWEADCFLLHDRKYTQGEPKYNYNNHPLESDRFILVHNGIVSDDLKDILDVIPKDKFDTKVETDSYVINQVAELFGITSVPSINGSMSILMYDKQTKELHAFRKNTTMPLMVGYSEEAKMIVFASTSSAIEEAFKKRKYLFNILEISESGSSSSITKSELKPGVLYTAKVFDSDIKFRKTFSFAPFVLHFKGAGQYHCAIYTIDKNLSYVVFKDTPSQKMYDDMEENFDKVNNIWVVDNVKTFFEILSKHKVRSTAQKEAS